MTAGFFRSLLAGILLSTGCAANVRDTDLLASNSLMLPPSTARTVFLQNRNASDNQAVSLHDLRARLNLKGYEVVQDPQAAGYVVLTNIVYCNQTKVELPVEDLVAGGYGSGIGGSIMSGLHGLTGVADLQITELARTGGTLPVSPPGTTPPAGVYQTRLAASVYQKKLDEQEATPLVQQRLSAAVAGHF